MPRVVSINTSGHKFGLTFPGLGWIIWRDEKFLHKDLIFELRKLLKKNLKDLFGVIYLNFYLQITSDRLSTRTL